MIIKTSAPQGHVVDEGGLNKGKDRDFFKDKTELQQELRVRESNNYAP